jgi:hypothetical protein
MIARYALIGALTVLLAAAAWISILRVQKERLAADVSRLEREVAVQQDAAIQAREAARVAQAYRDRAADRATEAQNALEALIKGDFADADTPVDPRIADYLDCLRRAEGGDAGDCAAGLRRSAPARPDQ